MSKSIYTVTFSERGLQTYRTLLIFGGVYLNSWFSPSDSANFYIQRGRNLEKTDTFAPRLFPGPPSVCKYRSPRNMKLVLHCRIYCDPTIWEIIWTCFWVINVAKLFHVLFILFQHFCSLLLRCYCGPMTKNWCEYKASLKFSLSDFNIFITNVTF